MRSSTLSTISADQKAFRMCTFDQGHLSGESGYLPSQAQALKADRLATCASRLCVMLACLVCNCLLVGLCKDTFVRESCLQNCNTVPSHRYCTQAPWSSLGWRTSLDEQLTVYHVSECGKKQIVSARNSSRLASRLAEILGLCQQ